MTSGYVFKLFGGVVSWMGRKHYVVALSLEKAKYIVATHASKEAILLQQLCTKIGFQQQVVRFECDSRSAIFLAKNQHIIQRKIILTCNIISSRRW
jgi:hypothetical protein